MPELANLITAELKVRPDIGEIVEWNPMFLDCITEAK